MCGIFLDAAFLKSVEFLARLPVEVLAVHDEHAFFDVGVVLEQGGGLERGERLAAAGGVPDIAVAAILVNAIHDGLDRVDLIRTHHHQLLLAGNQHHVAADHLTQGAFGKEGLRKAVEMRDLLVVLGGELIDGQKALVGIEAEMAAVVVGEIPGIASIADDEKLHEAKQRLGIAVAGVVLVVDNLLHGPARADAEGFQLDLHHRHAVDEQDDVVTLVAVVGIDAELVDDFKRVFAPVLDVDQGVVQRRAIIAGEAVALAEGFGGGEDIRGDDFLEKTLKLGYPPIEPDLAPGISHENSSPSHRDHEYLDDIRI